MISILIITYNRPDDLLDLLKSINALHNDNAGARIKDVLILNNNSTTDYTLVTNYITNEFQFKYDYIFSDENLGVSRGRNFLVEKSTAELLLFLDDDVCFSPFDLQLLNEINTDTLFSENNAGIITYHIRYFENGEIQPSAFPHKKLQAKKSLHKFLTYYYTGAVHIMKKSVFDKCGLYPTDFFYGMEEYDLSYRALNSGFSIAYSDSITFFHKESPLGRRSKKEKLRMMWVNKSKIAYRYLPKKYFYSTAIMWSLEYIRKAGFDIKGWLAGWKQVFQIPETQVRKPIKKETIEYLKKVEARLWY